MKLITLATNTDILPNYNLFSNIMHMYLSDGASRSNNFRMTTQSSKVIVFDYSADW